MHCGRALCFLPDAKYAPQQRREDLGRLPNDNFHAFPSQYSYPFQPMLESAQAADAAKDEKKRDQKHQRPHRKNSRDENTEPQRQRANTHAVPRAEQRRSRRARRRIRIHAFPLLSRRSPAPFYTKAAAAFLLYRDKASNFVMLSFVILDILSSLCNIKNNFT